MDVVAGPVKLGGGHQAGHAGADHRDPLLSGGAAHAAPPRATAAARAVEALTEAPLGPATEPVEGQSQQRVEEPPGALQPQLGVPDHGAAAACDRADVGLIADRDAVGLSGEDDACRRLTATVM